MHILDVALFQDLVDRLLPGASSKALLDLAKAAEQNEHGAMLVISSDAAGEAERLSPQSWAVEPVPLSPELLRQLTSMDGAVLVDPQGRCHAIGVILDGRAAGHGDPARGSRFNNAVRYLDTEPPPAVVVVYSADGSIDILPWLHPRVERERVELAVQRYLELAAERPPRLEDIYRARDTVKAFRFYLSEAQCRDVNLTQEALNNWRYNDHRTMINDGDLTPDPRMNDSYWIE
ncbi:MAG: diadenylate cyclase [Gammaproteobacteria bacterium]